MIPPHFYLKMNTNIGGQIAQNNYTHKKSRYLSEEQATHVYKMMESGGIIYTNTLKQGIEEE